MIDRKVKLTFDYLRDLLTDIRCARRDGLERYAREAELEFRAYWPNRHRCEIGIWGMPVIPEEMHREKISGTPARPTGGSCSSPGGDREATMVPNGGVA